MQRMGSMGRLTHQIQKIQICEFKRGKCRTKLHLSPSMCRWNRLKIETRFTPKAVKPVIGCP